MINGVKVKQLKVHQDIPDLPANTMALQTGVKNPAVKPGLLMEVLRDDDKMLKRFGQSTFTIAYSGTIKAFHNHKKQDDLWFVATGKARVVLYDDRQTSPSRGKTQVILAGENEYKLILIPAGVLHGYQVLSKEPVLLFYHTTHHYNPKNPDEIRVAADEPRIGFRWNK